MPISYVPSTNGDVVTVTPGLHWRGISITRHAYTVDVLPGLYILPFSTTLVTVSVSVEYLHIHCNVRWVCWRLAFGWLPVPCYSRTSKTLEEIRTEKRESL